MDGLPSSGLAANGACVAAPGALLARRSVSTKLMDGPGPSGDELEMMVAAAVRAPDHGGMRPWRFACVQEKARSELGAVFASAFARRNPEATPDQLAREQAKPLRAPMLVAVAAAIRADHPMSG